MINWLPPAVQALENQDYASLVPLYEAALGTHPEDISLYLYLGVAYLLNDEAEEAQGTWFYAFTNTNPEALEDLTVQLANLLETEAQRQENFGNLYLTWLIRKNLQKITPEASNNFLKIIDLELEQNQLSPETLAQGEAFIPPVDKELLLKVFLKLIYFTTPETLQFIKTTLDYIEEQDIDLFIGQAFPLMQEVSIKYQISKFGADLVEVFLEKRPHNKSLLHAATVYFDMIQDYPKSLEYARRMYENSQALSTKVYANYLHLFCSLKAGFWQDSQDLIQQNDELLNQLLLAENEQVLEPLAVRGFINIGTVLPYLGDRAKEIRQYTNLISQISYKYYCENYPESPVTPKQHEKLRIGYLAETFRRHSVGWLSRWLFKYHDREQFTIAIYLLGANHEDELTEKFFQPQADIYRYLDTTAENIAEQIREDEIDILVELDSLTSNLTCRILSLKPAPIQVTWLGYDATGLPTVDYFIADPYALPAKAEEYYREKIWRLPQTYLAVDGFEVDVPTRSRRELGIPEDGIVYFSVQNALKRHPEMIRTQMAILKSVENSYFLIKGCEGKPKAMELFRQIALEEGVDPAILHFLPQDTEEAQHRANLRLADVVLDTYPYSGATTTLEVLWMEIPLVTRVGEQFLSRNSYAFMVNAGIRAGIAYSEAEYIDWGIRLGRDEELRSQIAWQLHAGKSHAPIWNTPAFVKELEEAYKKMHQHHDNRKDPYYNVG